MAVLKQKRTFVRELVRVGNENMGMFKLISV